MMNKSKKRKVKIGSLVHMAGPTVEFDGNILCVCPSNAKANNLAELIKVCETWISIDPTPREESTIGQALKMVKEKVEFMECMVLGCKEQILIGTGYCVRHERI